jgi:hypothetical protein
MHNQGNFCLRMNKVGGESTAHLESSLKRSIPFTDDGDACGQTLHLNTD